MNISNLGLLNVLPIMVLVIWTSALLLFDIFVQTNNKRTTPMLAALGLLLSIFFTIPQIGSQTEAFGGMLVIDGFSIFLNLLVLFSGIVAIALSYSYLNRMDIEQGEYYIFILYAISGIMLMTSAADLIVVFLALELFSLPLYIMAAFDRGSPNSEEAGVKYFILGAFSGGFILYGIALVYGATATTSLAGIALAAEAGLSQPMFFLIGAALILVGLSFKVAAVPFHMWTPDVYQGSPSSSTAFMAVIAKIGGFAALLRIFIVALPSLSDEIVPVLWGLAAATLVVGNVLAIAQKNIKRLLAYSSIGHAGYILMAFVAYGNDAVRLDLTAAILFYLLAFSITSFGAWAVVILMEKAGNKGLEISDYAGLAQKSPVLALAMAIFMFSFTGIPPTLGFAGKLFLFRIVIDAGFIGLAVLGVVTSLISAYYYLRVIVVMYMQTGNPKPHVDPMLTFIASSAAFATVALLIFSQPLFRWAADAVLRLF